MRLHRALVAMICAILCLFAGCIKNEPNATASPAPSQSTMRPSPTKETVTTPFIAPTIKNTATPQVTIKPTPMPISTSSVLGKHIDFLLLKQLFPADNQPVSGFGIGLFPKGQIPPVSSALTKDEQQYFFERDGVFLADTNIKQIYITFDVGYENGNTATILDILKEKNVKSIFFITKQFEQAQPQLVARMIAEGHLLGNHTDGHPNLATCDDAQLKKAIEDFHDYILQKYDVTFRYLRPPSGGFNERVLTACQMMGYKTIFWSFAYHDYDVSKQPPEEEAYLKVMDHLHNGEIMLLHTVSVTNRKILPRIIDDMRAQGYALPQIDLNLNH